MKRILGFALLKMPREWRIMGGDAAQLEDVAGTGRRAESCFR